MKRACTNNAELVYVCGETVIIDNRLDVVEARKKNKVAPWQAIWQKIVVHAETRGEAIELIADRIRRKRALTQLEEYYRQKRLQRAVADLVARQKG
jgi:hypothetical protein